VEQCVDFKGSDGILCLVSASSAAQHCAVDERHNAGVGVTMTLIAVVLTHVVLVAPGEILTFINQHLLTRSD